MTDPIDSSAPDSPRQELPESSPDAPQGTPLKPPPAITIRPPSAESLWSEIVIAVNYLTRLNLRQDQEPKPRMIRKSMAWFPVIGAIIGIFGASVDWVITQIGLPGIITAAFAVISMLWITRALHEEEFASMANMYGRNFDKDQKVGWLKEERSVQYGTLAVIIVIIMKIGAIASLSDSDVVFQALIASACWSRALMVVMAGWLRPLPGDPVSDYFQQPPVLRVFMALAMGIAIVFAALGASYAPMALGLGAGAGLVVALAGANHLRGYNGPLLGTMQEIIELTVLGYILSAQ